MDAVLDISLILPCQNAFQTICGAGLCTVKQYDPFFGKSVFGCRMDKRARTLSISLDYIFDTKVRIKNQVVFVRRLNFYLISKKYFSQTELAVQLRGQ